MTRLEKPSFRNATLSRRAVLAAGGCAALLAGCQEEPLTASRTPRLDMERLNREVSEIARAAQPGALGVGLMNLESGEHFSFAGDRRFPLAGAVVLPLAAAALAEADAGRLSLDEGVSLEAQQLSPPPSPIAAAWPGRRVYRLDELLAAAMAGDATAADVLMKRIGGPGAVTAWLDGRRVQEVRVDRYLRESMMEAYGLPSFRPEWRTEGVFAQALAMQPQQARLAAMRRYMADPRDTATPRGMLQFLGMLDEGQLLGPASTRRLLRLVMDRGPALARPDLGLQPAAADAGFFTAGEGRVYAQVTLAAGVAAAEIPRILADVGEVARTSVG